MLSWNSLVYYFSYFFLLLFILYFEVVAVFVGEIRLVSCRRLVFNLMMVSVHKDQQLSIFCARQKCLLCAKSFEIVQSTKSRFRVFVFLFDDKVLLTKWYFHDSDTCKIPKKYKKIKRKMKSEPTRTHARTHEHTHHSILLLCTFG